MLNSPSSSTCMYMYIYMCVCVCVCVCVYKWVLKKTISSASKILKNQKQFKYSNFIIVKRWILVAKSIKKSKGKRSKC